MTAVLFNETSVALGASNTFTGPARDAGNMAQKPFTYFNAFFIADQTGTAFIDVSNDATTWYVAANTGITASNGVFLSVPLVSRYHRARLVNGTTLQTVLMINTSYSDT